MTDQFDKRQAAARTRVAARKQREEIEKGQDRITIIGPQSDGTYVIEFRTAAGETLAISIPRTESVVIEYFQKRMANGIAVPDKVKALKRGASIHRVRILSQYSITYRRTK